MYTGGFKEYFVNKVELKVNCRPIQLKKKVRIKYFSHFYEALFFNNGNLSRDEISVLNKLSWENLQKKFE